MTVQYDGQAIYENFQKGPGPQSLITSADTVRTVVGEYRALAARVNDLVLELESVWQGAAGEAARRGGRPVVDEHELAAGELSTAEDLTSRQVDSFIDARNRVVPVPPAPTEVRPWVLDSPETAQTFLRQVSAHLTAAQNNVDVMNGYAGASDHNTVHLPRSYGTLTSADIPLNQAGSWLSGAGGLPGPRGTASPRPGRADERRDRAGEVEPGGGSAAPVAPPPGTEAGPGQAREDVAGQTAGSSAASNGVVGASAPVGPGSAGETSRTTGLVGGPGVVGAPGARGTGGVRAAGPLGVGGGRGHRGPGATRGPSVAESVPARPAGDHRAASARPGAGHLGAAPSVGAARREDDEERRAPAYLEEHDPEALFGYDGVVSPATIGLAET